MIWFWKFGAFFLCMYSRVFLLSSKTRWKYFQLFYEKCLTIFSHQTPEKIWFEQGERGNRWEIRMLHIIALGSCGGHENIFSRKVPVLFIHQWLPPIDLRISFLFFWALRSKMTVTNESYLNATKEGMHSNGGPRWHVQLCWVSTSVVISSSQDASYLLTAPHRLLDWWFTCMWVHSANICSVFNQEYPVPFISFKACGTFGQT